MLRTMHLMVVLLTLNRGCGKSHKPSMLAIFFYDDGECLFVRQGTPSSKCGRSGEVIRVYKAVTAEHVRQWEDTLAKMERGDRSRANTSMPTTTRTTRSKRRNKPPPLMDGGWRSGQKKWHVCALIPPPYTCAECNGKRYLWCTQCGGCTFGLTTVIVP